MITSSGALSGSLMPPKILEIGGVTLSDLGLFSHEVEITSSSGVGSPARQRVMA
jgi:hypothetical protein